MGDITKLFGSMVFNESVMQARLPKEIYHSLKKTIEMGKRLDADIADVVANAMKDWAVEKGATHFTHWFQPMTGITAEKHDSFISTTADGTVIMEFSGTELVRGEPDASSFPSGGLRATFEARGYTTWDPTSYAFVKDNTLYIPTAFCSYNGEALDKKTPLLRSMQAIDKQAVRLLRLLGDTETERVISMVGSEQEYFLIDKEICEKRTDLIFCGRTLFGARPPKTQELEDHYFGKIEPRVFAYMKDLEEELWELGVPAKTKHNEVAPAQYELAPIYTTTNIATDQNQLTMELMKTVARKHGLVCLLHEKPFAGINGSGKHNNWSIATNKGENLLDPGDEPFKDSRFLLFLLAIVKAVDKHQDLLRIAVAGAGNDHRLGANEAPPGIVSVFLGEEMTQMLDAIENGTLYTEKSAQQIESGARVLPHLPKDNSDRNRTSPFAFTGNKFEFRMPGSSFSVADANIMINAIVADTISDFCDEIEKATDRNASVSEVIQKAIREHRRIIFNGNNYSDNWVEEAGTRGLLNLETTVDALPYLLLPENLALFEKHRVFSQAELLSRYDIQLENYCKTIQIEALTMIDLVRKEILPAVLAYEKDLAELANSKRLLSEELTRTTEVRLLQTISNLSGCLYEKLELLEDLLLNVKHYEDNLLRAKYYREAIFLEMQSLRGIVDELETLVAKKRWKTPTYAELLYSIH